MRRLRGSAALLTVASLMPLAAAPSFASSPPGLSAATVVSAKGSGGSLRVVAEGVPQGRTAKITVAGKEYRKKIPTAGKLRNLRPGTYRVWATPIVTDGGTSAVADLPVRVKVRSKRTVTAAASLHLESPVGHLPSCGPASDVEVTSTTTDAIGLRMAQPGRPRHRAGGDPPQTGRTGAAVPRRGPSGARAGNRHRGHRFRGPLPHQVLLQRLHARHCRQCQPSCVGHGTYPRRGRRGHRRRLPHLSICSSTRVSCPWSMRMPARGIGSSAGGRNLRPTRRWHPRGRHDEPVLIDLDDVVQVAAGGDHTCARQGDGQLWCWGQQRLRSTRARGQAGLRRSGSGRSARGCGHRSGR